MMPIHVLINSLPSISQFSDNGLVHFQSVDENQQYLFPAPSAAGFPGNVNVSLLAAFWDDSDLTHGGGRLLYQVTCKVKLSPPMIHCFTSDLGIFGLSRTLEQKYLCHTFNSTVLLLF